MRLPSKLSETRKKIHVSINLCLHRVIEVLWTEAISNQKFRRDTDQIPLDILSIAMIPTFYIHMKSKSVLNLRGKDHLVNNSQ